MHVLGSRFDHCGALADLSILICNMTFGFFVVGVLLHRALNLLQRMDCTPDLVRSCSVSSCRGQELSCRLAKRSLLHIVGLNGFMADVALKRGLLATVTIEELATRNLRLALRRHHQIGWVLHTVEVVNIHGDLFVVTAVSLLFHGLSLAVGIEGVFGKDFFASGAKALEKQASLNSSDHVIFLLGDEITSLHLEILLVLALALLDVVAQALLLNAGPDHLFLVFGKLFIGHWRLRNFIAGCSSSTIRCSCVVFMEILSVAQRGCLVEISLKSSLHNRQLALHG